MHFRAMQNPNQVHQVPLFPCLAARRNRNINLVNPLRPTKIPQPLRPTRRPQHCRTLPHPQSVNHLPRLNGPNRLPRNAKRASQCHETDQHSENTRANHPYLYALEFDVLFLCVLRLSPVFRVLRPLPVLGTPVARLAITSPRAKCPATLSNPHPPFPSSNAQYPIPKSAPQTDTNSHSQTAELFLQNVHPVPP